MQFITYLYFDGNCQQALYRYQNIFKGEILTNMKFGDQPDADIPDELKDLVMHAEMSIGDNILYFSDSPTPIKLGENVQININCDSEEEIKNIYNELTENGTITMELQDTFWGAIYGALIDQFGICWSFNYQKPQV